MDKLTPIFMLKDILQMEIQMAEIIVLWLMVLIMVSQHRLYVQKTQR